MDVPKTGPQTSADGAGKTGPEISPAISLVIPVYNRPDMIAACLHSLAPSLDRLREVIVVDDGSTDGATPAAIEATIAELGAGDRIRLIRQDNAGPGAARNRGAAEAQGDWIAFLDSDDMWLPWSGETLAGCIADNPDAIAVFDCAPPFSENDEIASWSRGAPVRSRHDGFFALGAIEPGIVRAGSGYFAVRAGILRDSGGFVPGLRGSEDTDLFYRIADAGIFVANEQPPIVARRTVRDDSLTHNMSAVGEGIRFLLDGRESGRYGAKRPDLDWALARLLAAWLHAMFYRGWGREAYDLLLLRGGFGIMMRNGYKKKALKLVAIPLLSVIRPRNHKFSWRPKTG